MFGGLRCNEQGNNVFARLKKMLYSSLIGISCSVHVLNNNKCIHYGAERKNIDIENEVNIFLFTQLKLNNCKNTVNLQVVNA